MNGFIELRCACEAPWFISGAGFANMLVWPSLPSCGRAGWGLPRGAPGPEPVGVLPFGPITRHVMSW